ncbi:MAG: acetylglutamate kinase [Chloroflexi bacterium]|nr:acetylglutamate kinase [Chloroflexota bacterium]
MPNPPVPLVVKIGGSTLGQHDTSLDDLARLHREGEMPVVVHGGGPLISQWMQRQGLVPRFVRGLRVTDAPSLEIVVAVLTGLVNKQLVAGLNARGGPAVGISGIDGALFQARQADAELGLVGDIVQVNPAPVTELLGAGYLPVIAPVAMDLSAKNGAASPFLNVNGDTAAGHLAWALGAQTLVFLTDVEGVQDGSGRTIARLTPRGARQLIAVGVAHSGMVPKLEACIKALDRVPVAHIADGRVPQALLHAVREGRSGTRIVREV